MHTHQKKSIMSALSLSVRIFCALVFFPAFSLSICAVVEKTHPSQLYHHSSIPFLSHLIVAQALFILSFHSLSSMITSCPCVLCPIDAGAMRVEFASSR